YGQSPIEIGLYNNFPAIGYIFTDFDYPPFKQVGFTMLDQNGNIITIQTYIYFNGYMETSKRFMFDVFINKPQFNNVTAIWAENRDDNFSLFAHKLDIDSIMATSELFEESEILVYPNPVSDYLFVKSKNIEIQKIELLNIEGKKLSEYNNSIINFKEFPVGIYILKIYSKDGLLQTKKVIKSN